MRRSEVTMNQVAEMNISERLELAETRVPVQSDVFQILAKNSEQRRVRRELVESNRDNKEIIYYANGEVDIPADEPLTMSQVKKLDIEQLVQLSKKHVRVSAMVYMILDQGNKNLTPRKDVVKRYGTGPEIEYYADGLVKTPTVTLCTLLKPGICPKK